MINISELKSTLMKLCGGTYSHADVDYVVEILRAEAEKYLAPRLFKLRNSSSPEAYRKTLTDHAYDFIGPLLGRESDGRFHILNKYFTDFWHVENEEFTIAFRKFIHTRFHTELIREIEEADGLNKSLHRTINYLLKKHPQWERTQRGPHKVLTAPGCADSVADISELRRAFRGKGKMVFSKYIEGGLSQLLEDWNLLVPMGELRAYIREIVASDMPSGEDRTHSSPDLELTRSQLLNETMQEIDRTVLQKYSQAEKLNQTVRIAFLKSIELLLNEWSEYASTRNHADYLALYLPGGITVEDYRAKYRSQFEYAVREARGLFSAKLKKILNT